MNTYSFESSKAFVNTCDIKPYQSGPLDGLRFAVKDNIDLAGFKTSYGSKSWLQAHPPAVCHALCVEQLLGAGAHCLGKTISDEFTYSLDGESYFYGTPINPKAPERIPGGSSSGSASAVACGLVDFAIGTDCAGSTRVPASLCGIWGMRPSTHRISEAGVLPFVPSFSTVGIFSQKLSVLEKVMQVLLRSSPTEPRPIENLYFLEDAFKIAEPEVREALEESILRLKQTKNIRISSITFSDITGDKIDLIACNEKAFRIFQNAEVWNSIGSWIAAYQPELGPRAREGLEEVQKRDRTQLNETLNLCERLFTKISQFTKAGDLFCFPTVPVIAPIKGELDDFDKAMHFYDRTMAVTSFAGVGQLPEISIPVAKIGNIPVGLSLATGHRQDEFLLAATGQLFPNE
jgi:amidase